MKKLIYLIVLIVVLGLIVAGCTNSVAPPAEQNNTDNLTKGATINVFSGDSIQVAIDNASNGDIIYVHEGTYSECIVIDGVDLSLIAVGDVTITPSVPVCPGHHDTIQIYNSTCTIDGFTVEGGYCGIYARGMYFMNETEVDVTIRNNTMIKYEKGGIAVNGDLAIGQIYNNTIIGGGPLGIPDSAQNGIQIGYGATGTIQRNAVEGNWYTGSDWTACGILIFEANDVIVQGNSVKSSETGIAIEVWGRYFSSASRNKIVRNTIDGSEWGISVAADDKYDDVSANNNKVVNNIIKTESGNIGIYVGVDDENSTLYSATAENNKIIHNQISGYDTFIDDTGIASKVHANASE